MTNIKTNNSNKFLNFISKDDSKRFLPAFWEHGPFPERLSKNLSLLNKNDSISLASGVPNKELFSVKNITINHTLQLGKDSNENGSIPDDLDTNTFHIGNDSFFEHTKLLENDYNTNVPIESVFEYSDNTFGLNSTIDLYKKLINKFDYFNNNSDTSNRKMGMKDNDYDIVITSGTSASCFYLTQLLCDEDKTILIEEFTYPVILSNLSMTKGHIAPFNLNMNATQENGENPIDIVYLENLFTNWFQIYPNKPFPSVLYTIPIQNPTGLVQSSKHRREVYELCKKNNVLIIEDDPYGNILLTDDKMEENVTPASSSSSNDDKLKKFQISKKKYLSTLSNAASYLSIDTEGIVIRCESVSKVFAPGLRVGVIIANKFFIERLKNIIDCTTREISGASMTIFNECCYGMDKLLVRELQNNDIEPLDGWIQWCMNLSHRYKLRQHTLLQQLYKTNAFQKNLFKCIEPKFGMFLCIQLNLKEKKPQLLENQLNMEMGMQYMDYKLLENNLNAIIGTKLSIDKTHSFLKSGFIRVTVAQATGDEQLSEAARRLGLAIEQFFEEYLTDKQAYKVIL